MSAPHTNLDKQRRRHMGPLIGIAVVLLFVGGILVWWLTQEAADGASPTDSVAPELPASQELPLSTETPEVFEPGPQADPTDNPTPGATTPQSGN